MAGTINYLYDPNQQVWVIVACADNAPIVKEGKIVRVRGEVIVTAETLEYDVQITGEAGTVPVLEADTFSSLALAVAEYEIRLT